MFYDAPRDKHGRFLKGFSGNPNGFVKGQTGNPKGSSAKQRQGGFQPRKRYDVLNTLKGNSTKSLDEKQLDKVLKTNQKKMNDQKLLKLHHHRISIAVDKRLAEIEAEYQAGLKNG